MARGIAIGHSRPRRPASRASRLQHRMIGLSDPPSRLSNLDSYPDQRPFPHSLGILRILRCHLPHLSSYILLLRGP